MAKKHKPFNNPFAAAGEGLKKQIKQAKQKAKKAAEHEIARKKKKEEEEQPQIRDEQALFENAVQGIVRINDDVRGRVVPEPPPDTADGIPVYDEDAEAFAELVDFVEGRVRFDISDSDEFISGCIEGLDRRIVQKLKRNDFAVRAHLDLHGMTRDVAREAVERFVTEARQKHHRCVLIVHGRGSHSKDNIPVLKGLLQTWLERGRIARSVIAFCTARPHDGGQGAVYVLLRR